MVRIRSDTTLEIAKPSTMNPETNKTLKWTEGMVQEKVIGLTVFAILIVLCLRVVSPFFNLIMWALVLAVALYPLHQGLARKLGGKQGRASIVMVLFTMLLVGAPMTYMAMTVVGDAQNLQSTIESGGLNIPAPNPAVAEWPVVGEKLYKAWDTAATNMENFLSTYGPQLKDLSKRAIGASLGAVGSALLFLAAMAVAGIMMAYGQSGSKVMLSIADRLAGREKGGELHTLSVATIRSVATGVIGVAFIQALVFGLLFVIAQIPFPGILSIVVLIVCIIQLPALIIALPVIIYLWSAGDGSTIFNVVMTICFLVTGLADNVLKPMLLGRGVKVPMPVILVGALGGMVAYGFIGLFLGAVLLALCYEIFMGWVAVGDTDPADEASAPDEAAPATE